MRNFRSGEAQKAFMELLWANEPLSSGELVKQCEKEFGWKKRPSYTTWLKKDMSSTKTAWFGA